MRTKTTDPTMRWILSLTGLIVLCMAAMLLLHEAVPQQEDTQKVAILDISEQSMRLYAQIQKQTGIPWVLLCAVDRAEDVLPDLARVTIVAEVFVQAGAVERGLTIGPITNAADLAGLYTTDRKAIARISRQVLLLEDLYLMIQSGRFPADGGTVADEENGCGIYGSTQARSPFSGTVTSAADGVVDIDCDNGLCVHVTGVQSIQVAAGDEVEAGGMIGETPSFFISFWYGNRWIHPYPYLLLWN